MKYIFSIALFVAFLAPIHSQKIEYILDFENPQTHYHTVKMKISGLSGKSIDVKMPAWAPGSYMIREFAKNVDYFKVTSNTPAEIKWNKTDKNTWKITLNSAQEITIEYKVYSYELTVRTSFVDADHAYLNGSSVFMYIDGKKNLAGTLTVNPHKNWKKISCGLEKDGSDWKMKFPDYDVLADSPIEIGNQEVFYFETSGCKYEVAMVGEGNYDTEVLKKDMAKVIDEAVKVYGENPNKNYVFIVHNLTQGGGGLEHLNSTTLQVNRWTYENSYISFLSLVAHEYFHLWNVKRARALELGPFDYDEENYTTLLWVMEGFTSYYDELLLLRAGFYTEAEYIRSLTSSISSTENTPGTKVQNMSESSFDAWIKGYRTNENSYNSQISYYTKGSVLGALLDIEIVQSTNGEKHLDDLMKYMYDEYYKKLKRGYTEAEFKAAAEKITGKKMDDFFKDYVNSTKKIDYDYFFKNVGYELLFSDRSDEISLGIRSRDEGGKLIINTVVADGAGWDAGLNVNDEIISIDDYRVDQATLTKYLGMKQADEVVKVMISRDNLIKTIDVKLKTSAQKDFKLSEVKSADEKTLKLRSKWMK
jgi:predicted metalloprotease with PDZ domain